DAREELLEERAVPDVRQGDARARPGGDGGEVLAPADREVVDQDQLVGGGEPIGEVAADEAGGPRHRDPQPRDLHVAYRAPPAQSLLEPRADRDLAPQRR